MTIPLIMVEMYFAKDFTDHDHKSVCKLQNCKEFSSNVLQT